MKKKAILFVHGLNGSEKTWKNFKNLIDSDKSLNYKVYFYEFPSSLVRIIPFVQDKYGSPRALSGGLKTYIDVKLEKYDEVVLVGHSLGGILIKKYLVDQKVSNSPTKVKKVMFYAVPQEGSGVANAASQISFGHGHLKQLSKNSEFLDTLNDTWAISNVEESYDIRLVIATEDTVVTEFSAKANFRHAAIDFISGKGHISICKPEDKNDLSFLVLKNFLLQDINISKTRPNGSLNFAEWLQKEDNGPFFPDKKRSSTINQLRDALVQPRNIVRIIGLSGLGKTRTAIEAIRLLEDDFKKHIVYIDDAGESSNILSIVNAWVTDQARGILVVDNCSVALHDRLLRAIKRPESKLTLLTIDFDLQVSGDCSYIELERLDDEMIKKILINAFGDALPDIDRIVSFAQGFPQMAVLIARSRLNLESTVGKLDDDLIAHKLLWGEGGDIRPEDEKILQGCALFDRFGLEREASIDSKYIADNIIHIPYNEFYNCVKRFVERGIVDQRGRYAQLVPKPLAIRLASQWWSRNPPQMQDHLINSMPDSLVTSFCEQIGRLDFLPEVMEFTSNLCGFHGPFGQAEVILSNRGSRFFRAFVEINPEATSGALSRVLSSLTQQECLQVSGEIRRNLVWALEKLCFHAIVFEEAAWSLFLLAQAENETWSNNATGIFSQLFRDQLSGTSAPPDIRFNVLARAFALKDFNADMIIISATEQMINCRGHSRTVGAEYQGTKAPLQEWHASIWQEIFDMWQYGFDLLVEMLQRGKEQKERSLQILGGSIRSFLLRGRIDMLDKAIRQVIEINGKYWPTALSSLKQAIEFDSEGLPVDAKEAIERWLQLLDPRESPLSEKILILVTNPPWEHRDSEEGYIDVAAEKAKAFGDEFLHNLHLLNDHINSLLEGEQKQAYSFGQGVANSDDIDEFITIILGKLRNIAKPNLSLFLGILNGVHKIRPEAWETYMELIANDHLLWRFYVNLVLSGNINEQHLKTILHLSSSGKINLSNINALAYGSVTENFPPETISDFCLKFAKFGNESSWIAFEILYMYCKRNEETINKCKHSLIEIMLSVPLDDAGKSSQLDIHGWKELAARFIETEPFSFSSDICKSILKKSKNGLDYNNMWHYIKPLLLKIFTKYEMLIWPIFGDAIRDAQGVEKYWLKELLERENSLAIRQRSLFSVLPVAAIIEWCEVDPNKFPVFVASCIEVLNGTNLNPLAIALLENFGNDKRVGNALSANMSTRGWSGSLVPYLNADIEGLAFLVNHKNTHVRAWAREKTSRLRSEIDVESSNDAEETL